MTQPPTQPTPEQIEAINLLVSLALDPGGALLASLRRDKEAGLPQGFASLPDKADELERIRGGLKDAVRNSLIQNGISLTPDGSIALRDICADFCDRVSTGVDTWAWLDAERWRQVCQQVTDVASAEY